MNYLDMMFYPTMFSTMAIPIGMIALVALSEVLKLTTNRIVIGAIFLMFFIPDYFVLMILQETLFVETYVFVAPVAVFLPAYLFPRFAQLKSELVRVLACFVLVCIVSLYLFYFLFDLNGSSYVFVAFPAIVLVMDFLLASGIYHIMLARNILPPRPLMKIG